MRTRIAQVFDGIRYDTDSATLLASNEFWDGHSWERNGRNLHLYKSAKGRFFVVHSTAWQCHGEYDYIEPLSKQQTKYAYRKLPIHEIEYEESFTAEKGARSCQTKAG